MNNFCVARLGNIPLTDWTVRPLPFQKRAAEDLDQNPFIKNLLTDLPTFITVLLPNIKNKHQHKVFLKPGNPIFADINGLVTTHKPFKRVPF